MKTRNIHLQINHKMPKGKINKFNYTEIRTSVQTKDNVKFNLQYWQICLEHTKLKNNLQPEYLTYKNNQYIKPANHLKRQKS